MARDFTKNTSNYMGFGAGTLGTLLNGSAAMSVHCWFQADTFGATAGSDFLLFVFVQASSPGFGLNISTPAGSNVLRVIGRSQVGDTTQTQSGATDLAVATWYSAGAVQDIAGDAQRVYLNGAEDGSGAKTFGAATYTQGTTPSFGDGIGSDGAAPSGTATQLDGRIAEMALWSSDIGAANFAALAAGYSPLLISPATLIWYCPLLGYASPEIDLFGGRNGTITGTVADADHPRIIYPDRARFFLPAVPGPAVPRAMHQYRQRRTA